MVLFFWSLCLVLVSGNVGSQSESECSLCFCFLDDVTENWYNIFLSCLVEFTVNPSDLVLSFLGVY